MVRCRRNIRSRIDCTQNGRSVGLGILLHKAVATCETTRIKLKDANTYLNLIVDKYKQIVLYPQFFPINLQSVRPPYFI